MISGTSVSPASSILVIISSRSASTASLSLSTFSFYSIVFISSCDLPISDFPSYYRAKFLYLAGPQCSSFFLFVHLYLVLPPFWWLISHYPSSSSSSINLSSSSFWTLLEMLPNLPGPAPQGSTAAGNKGWISFPRKLRCLDSNHRPLG